MSPRPATSDRGVAMLMALATLMLVLAGVTAGLVALRGARQSAWVSEVDSRLLSGLRQGERLATAWLNTHSASVVLPPDGGGVHLVDDRFLLPGGEGRLSVVAYDGLAGIPACLAQRGGGLRTAMPTALMGLVLPPISPTQAEAFSFLLDSLEVPEGATRFPAGLPGSGRVWRAAGVLRAVSEASSEPASAGPSLAEAIAFHSDGRINLNTAPAPLLRAAYTVLGLGGVAEVLERRQQQQATKAPEGAAANGLRLVAQSDRWQMLITVSWQGIHRSWWVDFAGTPPSTTMVHRHDVSH